MIATHPPLNGLPTSAKKNGWHDKWEREFIGLTMSELLVGPATLLVIAVHTGQQVDRWEISMALDEEPEDTHGYQPSGFLNPLTLLEAKGYPSSRLPNLYGMATHMGIRNPPGFTLGNFQSTSTTRSPDQHCPSTTTVTMTSHTNISVSATLWVVISSLDYTQTYHYCGSSQVIRQYGDQFAEDRFTVQQLPPAVYSDSVFFFGFLLYVIYRGGGGGVIPKKL